MHVEQLIWKSSPTFYWKQKSLQWLTTKCKKKKKGKKKNYECDIGKNDVTSESLHRPITGNCSIMSRKYFRAHVYWSQIMIYKIQKQMVQFQVIKGKIKYLLAVQQYDYGLCGIKIFWFCAFWHCMTRRGKWRKQLSTWQWQIVRL